MVWPVIDNTRQALRVAVIGAGPSGAYAVQALCNATNRAGPVEVDVFDRLPTPYGLVRYGVAPDHVKMKSVIGSLRQMYRHAQVRFLGNVQVGQDLSIDDLRHYYDAVLLAVGAAVDRRLGIPGEDLPGSHSATDFVSWYSGHPDVAPERFTLDATSVVVIGVGNVALDVARVLAKSAGELESTDIPPRVLDALADSRITDIHILGRRGPAQAKFTSKELAELGVLANADVTVRPEDLVLNDADAAAVEDSPVLRRNLATLRSWAGRPLQGRPRRIHLRFFARPVELTGTDHVTGIRVERTAVDQAGNAVGTGQRDEIEAQLVLRSIGYRGRPIAGVPFDEESGVVPNDGGRVVDGRTPVPGLYVAGWIKRGPTGIIGTNKRDAAETVAAVLEDAPHLRRAAKRHRDAVLAALHRRGVHVVPWEGWEAIDAAELALGAQFGRGRVKIHDRVELLSAARG